MFVRSIPLMFLLVAAGCAASARSQSAQAGGERQSPSSLTEGSDEQDVTGPSQCLDDDNRPLQCERDTDCCPDFYCGRDPQVSDVMKVCISTGA